MNKIVIDLETTGFKSTDRITEIGMIKFNHFGIVDLFHTHVDCLIKVPMEIEMLTGINNLILNGFPQLKRIKNQILKFIGKSELYSYQAGFESRFLRQEIGGFEVNDLLSPIKKKYKLDSYKLFDVSSEILNYKLNNHSALSDAFAGYLIYQDLHSSGLI